MIFSTAETSAVDALTTSSDALPSTLPHEALSETTLSDKPDALSLKQAGNVASMSEVMDMPPHPPPSQKAFGSPDIAADSCSEDCMMGEVQTGAGGTVIYRINKKSRKNQLRVDELLFSVSPDSGTEMSVTAAMAESERGEEQPEMEPVEVSTAREEVAVLAAAKQRLEAQHKRIARTLRENRASVNEVREVRDGVNLTAQILGRSLVGHGFIVLILNSFAEVSWSPLV